MSLHLKLRTASRVAIGLYRESNLVRLLGDSAVPRGSFPRIDESVSGAFGAAHDIGGSNGTVVLDAARHAFIDGVRAASVVSFVLLIAAAIASSRLLPSRPR